MSALKTHVLKFGGSSLETPSLLKQSVEIVKTRMQQANPVVVVSAVGGVTDTLIALANSSAEGSVAPHQMITRLEQKHQHLFEELVSFDHPKRGDLQDLFGELRNTFDNQQFRKTFPRAWKDHLLSVGERASSIIFAAALSEQGICAESYKASQFIKTDSTFGQARVDEAKSRKLIRKFLINSEHIPVITGFIGSDNQQRITTLGRSGSDYTASLAASALKADHLEIWTDVNGVLSADPQWVPSAESIEQLSYHDIAELSAHGAKVIHPKTINPLQNSNTTVRVKNSYNPVHPGTLITSNYRSNGALKTITVTGPFVRLQLDGSLAFELLDKLTTWLETEPDSEAIGFKRYSGFEPAQFLIRQSLFEQISDQFSQWAAERNVVPDLKANLYKVKKFSNQFGNEPLTTRILNLFNSNGIQPIDIDRNYDNRFISFLFTQTDAQKAAQLMNSYLKGNQTIIDLFVAGTGAIGSALLKQLQSLKSEDITFRLLGICNSRKTIWNEQGIDIKAKQNWSEARQTDWPELVQKLTQPHRHNVIFIDATGHEEVARLYPQLLQNSINIVTPSKLANTFEQSYFDRLQKLSAKYEVSFRYETTVGAGLPVISSIKNLITNGDQIHKITGAVSGTMTYLFHQLEQGIPFSKAVTEARRQGYAEPDPRDDLSGEDVARKFLTLARLLGYSIERTDLKVESLIPEKLRLVEQETFLKEMPNYDDNWRKHIKSVQKSGKTLRYVGELQNGKITIGIQAVAKNSPLGQLKETDNAIQIFSKRYNKTPLVIQGPGAGKEVTASGIINDILKIAEKMS